MMKRTAKERNYGIDALKILAMFMVVILHIMNQGGVLNGTVKFTGSYEAGWMLQSAAFCAVDVYALASGYVWVCARFRYRNIMELWLQVLFYTVSITALFCWLLPGSVTPLEWLKAIFPTMSTQYWYFSSYVALFLFIPLLNVILKKTGEQQLRLYLGIILFFFSGVQTLLFSDALGTNDGYSSIWLMLLYLVGGFIRKYGLWKNGTPSRFLAGYCAMAGLTWLSKLVIEQTTLHLLGQTRAGNYFISYKSPTVLLSAVFLLLFFERLHVSSFWKKVVGTLSPVAFGVYLIHGHPLVYSHLLKDRFVGYAALSWPMEILAVLGTAASINLLCYAIDFLRLTLFEKLRIQQRLDALEDRAKQIGE